MTSSVIGISVTWTCHACKRVMKTYQVEHLTGKFSFKFPEGWQHVDGVTYCATDACLLQAYDAIKKGVSSANTPR